MYPKSVIGVLGVALTILVAGCGGQSPTSTHDTADVTFAQQMIPHHQQAVAMAELAADRAGNDQVKQLAARIRSAQDPEITRMQGFLAAWGAPASGDTAAMPDMGAMPGMMSGADLARLGQARGTDFDRLFLQMMTAHHQGAITMATTELADGADPQAKALAQDIVTAQRGEITEMKGLLATP